MQSKPVTLRPGSGLMSEHNRVTLHETLGALLRSLDHDRSDFSDGIHVLVERLVSCSVNCESGSLGKT